MADKLLTDIQKLIQADREESNEFELLGSQRQTEDDIRRDREEREMNTTHLPQITFEGLDQAASQAERNTAIAQAMGRMGDQFQQPPAPSGEGVFVGPQGTAEITSQPMDPRHVEIINEIDNSEMQIAELQRQLQEAEAWRAHLVQVISNPEQNIGPAVSQGSSGSQDGDNQSGQ